MLQTLVTVVVIFSDMEMVLNNDEEIDSLCILTGSDEVFLCSHPCLQKGILL